MTRIERKSSAMNFPMVIKLAVVAKYLCSFGQNESKIDFDQPHKLFLEREPSNAYDRRAIRVAVT